MKRLFLLVALLVPLAAEAQTRDTTCNLRYNNMGIIHGNIPCRATFSQGRLQRLRFTIPGARSYDWTVGQGPITADPRWPECVRHTNPTSGNQWQGCSVPSPAELGVAP
jgi:hypothetical protein